MTLIVFVCGSNRSRSPMAAAYFARLVRERGLKDIEVASAGLHVKHGETVAQEAREALRREGLEPLEIGVTQLLPKLIKRASLLVCMTPEQQDRAEDLFISAKGKVRPLMSFLHSNRPIAEPPKGDLKRHIECLETMKEALEALADVVA